jgi:hypothetical protein
MYVLSCIITEMSDATHVQNWHSYILGADKQITTILRKKEKVEHDKVF